MKDDIQQIILKLSNGEINTTDIPEEYQNEFDLIKAERKLGLRKFYRRGYNILSDNFFVEEFIYQNSSSYIRKKQKKAFDNFESYFTYLEGSIYFNSCYYQLDPRKLPSSVNLNRLFEYNSFIEQIKLISIDDFVVSNNVNESGYVYSITKGYEHDANGYFYVYQEIKDNEGNTIKKEKHNFDYFCDFIAFLKGDLSNADLLFCDGLINLISIEGINFSNAIIKSDVCRKFNIPYKKFFNSLDNNMSFSAAEINEFETSLVLKSSRDLESKNNNSSLSIVEDKNNIRRIYYISDLHLYHLFNNKKVESESDAIYVIKKLVDTIIKESKYNSIVLINGDTSLDFSIFELFIAELKIKKRKRTIIFTIGNHDIWSCPNDTFEQLKEKYRIVLEESDMYLLQNNVILIEGDNVDEIFKITEDEFTELSQEKLKEKVKYANIIFFGGTGFAGYNPFYNAEIGLYRYNLTIGYDRDFEIKESQKIEKLYRKACKVFEGKNVVIMTHMPLPDWYNSTNDDCIDYEKDEQGKTRYNNERPNDNIGDFSEYNLGFVYISGHTHRNFHYDDGEIRIYADNQFGYNKSNPSAWPHLKYFDIEKTYDIFAAYKDGIYEISVDDYIDFYNGKNIFISFNRNVDTIYMLKKRGYYCFIYKNKNKHLLILNGGNPKRLDNDDVKYYFEHMDSVISKIDSPLAKYSNYQKRISEEIKRIGGYGSIHGCIIDVDFYNHIYVNPYDFSTTGYWAKDIVNKVVYPTIADLLKAHCPQIYANYEKMITDKSYSDLPTLSAKTENPVVSKPVEYYDTDIYNASREISKMQRLNSNILTTWPDVLPLNKMLS